MVTHKSTNPAQHCLTSVIRQELVLSVWYGRRHQVELYKYHFFAKGHTFNKAKLEKQKNNTGDSQVITHQNTNWSNTA